MNCANLTPEQEDIVTNLESDDYPITSLKIREEFERLNEELAKHKRAVERLIRLSVKARNCPTEKMKCIAGVSCKECWSKFVFGEEK